MAKEIDNNKAPSFTGDWGKDVGTWKNEKEKQIVLKEAVQKELENANETIHELQNKIKSKNEETNDIIMKLMNEYDNHAKKYQDMFEKQQIQNIDEKLNEFNQKYQITMEKLTIIKNLHNKQNVENEELKKLLKSSSNEEKFNKLVQQLDITTKQKQQLENDMKNLKLQFQENLKNKIHLRWDSNP